MMASYIGPKYGLELEYQTNEKWNGEKAEEWGKSRREATDPLQNVEKKGKKHRQQSWKAL
jgi:hypothetical protein